MNIFLFMFLSFSTKVLCYYDHTSLPKLNLELPLKELREMRINIKNYLGNSEYELFTNSYNYGEMYREQLSTNNYQNDNFHKYSRKNTHLSDEHIEKSLPHLNENIKQKRKLNSEITDLELKKFDLSKIYSKIIFGKEQPYLSYSMKNMLEIMKENPKKFEEIKIYKIEFSNLEIKIDKLEKNVDWYFGVIKSIQNFEDYNNEIWIPYLASK